MNEYEFRQLIGRAESETLDFKEEVYDFGKPQSRDSFIKDVLAMANTPREQPAHIVFGVRWTPQSGSTVVGLARQLDDAELQSRIGPSRVQPVPRFTYSPFEFEGKQVGILEIPVGQDGPYTAINDFEKLRAGAVYYRQGSTNALATGLKPSQIFAWFQDGITDVPDNQETGSWHSFFEAVHQLEEETAYLLAVDRISSKTVAPVHAMGMVPWRAVIDFDPASEESGFLSRVEDTLQRHRVIHRVVRGQRQMVSEPGTRWFFARGLDGRQNTLSLRDHRSWLVDYKQELADQLRLVAAAISPAPVVVLVLWSDDSLRKHLRTLMEEIYAALGQQVEIVVVSSDEPAFAGFVEQEEAEFVRMDLRSLCNGVAVHYADLLGGDDERYVLPTLSGSWIELERRDWLWLSEDIDLIHRSSGLSEDGGEREYRLGADVSWRNLHLRHDCDRDVTSRVRGQVESDLGKRQTVRINLYHAPGGGGTTVGWRVAWDLGKKFPAGVLSRCVTGETAGRIAKIAALTESSVLVVVDGGRHSENEIDDLYERLKADQTPVVLLQILRRFGSRSTGRRLFWLDDALTNEEADRFREVYSAAVPHRQADIASLARRHRGPQRSAFFFGLTAFGREFRGLSPYVKRRIDGLTQEQKKILVYIAMAYYYGQQPVPAQAFTSMLGLPHSRALKLADAFASDAKQALELLTEGQRGEWRISHHLIALEIMQQVLAPGDSREPEQTWRQNLSHWAKDFASFCRGDGQETGDRLLVVVRRVFIYRDNIEVLGTEKAAQRRFSQLIDNIPSDLGKVEVLRHLTDCFPLGAHFHAHLGRLLSLNGEYDEAVECIERALSIEGDDHVLHHMRGMILRQRLKAGIEAQKPIEHLIDIAKGAAHSFEEARRLRPDREHGYISEVQALMDLVDCAGGGSKRDVVRDVLARPATDPFLRTALERAEDLLDQVHRLYAGESPSQYFQTCRARLEIFYGNYQTALQAWDALLSRPEAAKPPVRRQIVWTILRRRGGVMENVSSRETERIRRLLEENLQEEVNDSTSLRLWLRAIRHSQTPPSLDSVIEKVGYWKANTGSLDAAYYLYVLHTLRALEGSVQGAADADRALEECRKLAQFRRDRTRSFEWLGEGDGVEALVHQSRLGVWKDDFWDSADVLARLDGRISSIGGPQKGSVELGGGVEAFFVPARSGFQTGRDENVSVSCYLGFSYDGPRAWEVRPTGAAE